MSDLTLPQGTLNVRDTGSGPPIVFVHGLLVDGTLWRKVVPLLSGEHRCIWPDWPLGSHTRPMNADADLTPRGVANLIADALEALDLDDVTLIGNDTGGGSSSSWPPTGPPTSGGSRSSPARRSTTSLQVSPARR